MEFQSLINEMMNFIGIVWPIAVPVFLIFLLFNTWVNYARSKFESEQEYALLRITPPKEILKTPAAMELFITGLFQTGGEANPVDVYYKGKSRAKFTLEIASNDGDVGFYIWTRTSLKQYVEGQIYAQYPGIEVTEVEDYSDRMNYDSGDYKMFAMEYKLTQPDPLPIKTYVDYGLDKFTDEESGKVDPITATLEFLGGLKSGENAWLQIHIKAHKKENKKSGKLFEKTDNWIDESKKMIDEIKKEGFYKDEKYPDSRPVPFQTEAQKDKIKAIERNISKPGFDVGIRAIYMAENDAFTGPNIGSLIGSFRQYGSPVLNGFKPGVVASFDYWWQDPLGNRAESMKKQMLSDYRNRVYFNTRIGNSYRNSFVLNTEELATIFHFPGGVASTPTLTRIQSRKGEAPTNLPR